MDKPYAGLRVVDFSTTIAGPHCTRLLADLGADVVKIEATDGDMMRSRPPQRAGASSAFGQLNAGKRSAVLDLKSEGGVAAARRLAARADVLVENFRPGVMDRLGVCWDTLHARNPRLVFCSLTGYGQSGPLALKAGHDVNYCAMTGVLDQIRAGGMPAMPNLQIGDLLGGTLTTLSALLAALLGAQRTGQGRRVDAAMTDGLLVHHIFPHGDLDAGQVPVAGRTLLTGGAPCYQIYPTADGRHLAVGALELKFWQAFCDAADLRELRNRHWTLGLVPGSEASAEVGKAVADRVRQKTQDDWGRVFADVDACVTPLLTPAEALAHPHHHARGLVHRRGGVTAVGPLAMIDAAGIAEGPAPRAGEHTRQLLAELGLDDDAIVSLLASRTATEAGP